MKYDVYTGIIASKDYSVFDFTSEGKNGLIRKRIQFTPTEMTDVYNLSFGDIDENCEIDDFGVSNNGDRNKILATIAEVVKSYTHKFPAHWIFFNGSTDERNRLYRMAVGLNLDELSVVFNIYAIEDGEIVPFMKNREISAFLIRRKNVILKHEKGGQF